jgi:hypothetical protein
VPAVGHELDDDRKQRLRAALRKQLSPGTCLTRSARCRGNPGPSGSRSGHHKEPSRRKRTRDGG